MIGRVRLAIDSVRASRIGRGQLGGVALVSALASALIISSATGRSAAQTAALAALAGRPTATPAVSVRGPAGLGGTPAVPVSAPPAASSSSPGSGTGSQAQSAGSGSATATAPASSTPAGSSVTPHHPSPHAPKHKVGHVFVIALSTPSFEAAWGTTSPAHYLNRTLKPKGVFLGGYETLGAAELPDYLAMVGGQAPNPDTEADCATYSEFPAGTAPGSNGQVPGSGCVYPNSVLTVADQVTAAGEGWRGYIDGLTPPSTCVHPNSGAPDDATLPGAGPDYDTRHNPLIYFHSLLDLGGCAANDVAVSQLPKDLHTAKSTPAYSLMAPGACEDGSAQSCLGGAPAGLAGEDAFLHRWVPVIEHSAAYKRDGVIVIVFALSGGQAGSGTSAPVGALVLSRWASPGQIVSTVYNPYSILRGTEDLLGLRLLGQARSAKSFTAAALPGT